LDAPQFRIGRAWQPSSIGLLTTLFLAGVTGIVRAQ
jgi:hypothetical protein